MVNERCTKKERPRAEKDVHTGAHTIHEHQMKNKK